MEVNEVPRVVDHDPEGRGALTVWVHPGWENRLPWLAQGTTGRSSEGPSRDFALFRGDGPSGARANWLHLAEKLGFPSVAHARQVHGREVLLHRQAPPGLHLGSDADGHLTPLSGLLMAVTVADCVPVFLVDPEGRRGGVLHAGWRGLAAGVLERGISILTDGMGSRSQDLLLHLGPSICGECYEVGPEVHGSLGLPVPDTPRPVDLRSLLLERGREAGVRPGNITRSGFCTLCGGSPFFSHRGGDPERQVGFLGFRHGGWE